MGPVIHTDHHTRGFGNGRRPYRRPFSPYTRRVHRSSLGVFSYAWALAHTISNLQFRGCHTSLSRLGPSRNSGILNHAREQTHECKRTPLPEPHPGQPWRTLAPPDPTSVAGPAHAKSRESQHSSHMRTQLYIPAGRLLSPSLSTSSFPAASSAAIEIMRFSGSGCREASTAARKTADLM